MRSVLCLDNRTAYSDKARTFSTIHDSVPGQAMSQTDSQTHHIPHCWSPPSNLWDRSVQPQVKRHPKHPSPTAYRLGLR